MPCLLVVQGESVLSCVGVVRSLSPRCCITLFVRTTSPPRPCLMPCVSGLRSKRGAAAVPTLFEPGFALCTLRARLSPLCSALCDTGFALATWHFVFPLRLPASDFRLQPLHFDFALVVRLCTCHFVFALRLCTCHFTITSSLHFAFATSGFAVRALRFSRCTSHLPLCTCYLVLRSAPHTMRVPSARNCA